MTKSKTKGVNLNAAEKRAQALMLREAGLTFQQIGRQIECSTTRAYQYVADELKRLADQASDSAESIRQLELERLDRMTTGIWTKAKTGDLRSIDRMIKIIEQRSKLLGLYAPTKLAATNKDGDDAQGGVFVVPAPAASVDEWLEQAAQYHATKKPTADE